MKKLWILVAVLALAATNAPPWAVSLEKPGCPNLHKVSDQLYRGAQPTKEGMRQLERMGVKTVVNLRSFNSDRDELTGTKHQYKHLWVKAWHPEEKEVVAFLKTVADTNSTPVFVHCQHGADRTGTMCAIYRIAVQGWTKEQAIEEMTKGNFGYHTVWKNLIKYINELDVPAIKKKATLSTNSPATTK
jgi:protein tyrosine/serine phosphatase